MAVSRVIEVSFGRSSVALVRIDTAYFYNNGILFKPTDIDLPTSYQVHWADSPQASSTLETIGTAEGAPIPDDLWNRSRVIYGWIYLHPTEDSGVTGYEVRIYKNVRAGLPDGAEPTPAEQSTIDQLIGALNSAVEQTGEDVESAEQAKDDAESARDNAQTYANNAQSSAQASARSAESASQSAQTASENAQASARNASQSAQIKADVEGMVDDAQSYAESALIASQASVTARDTAQGYANTASASAQSASTSASNASTSAQTASTKASEASTSAQTASTKATEASQSASQALTYKTDAESAKTASQTAQGLAESARDSAISAKTDAEQAKADAESARDEAQQAVASISGTLAEKAPVITDTASGAIASFSDGADNLPLKSLVVDINPVQDLHGQDAPYPAGGGKNILDPSLLKDQAAWNMIELSVKPNTSYIASTNKPQSVSLYTYFNNTGTAGGGSSTEVYNGHPVTVTSTADGKVYFSQRRADGTDSFQNYHFQLELGSTATAYAPYENLCPISGWTEVNVNHSDADMTNPTTLTIDLGQTVYGGHIDVLSGELVIDRAMVDLGTLNWVCSMGVDDVYVFSTSGVSAKAIGVTNVISDTFVTTNKTAWNTDKPNNSICGSAGSSAVVVRADDYADAASFKAAMSGVMLCYELATPIEIQLSANQINSLYEVNNIWADSGDTEVEYRADTKLFIERLTAPDSEDMVADANITSGKYFMVGNSLYKATANIANGSAIIVGTNCIRKSLSEALNEINA